MTSTCTICDSTHTQPCVQCHSTRYCSLECSQTDWPSHKLLCSQYSTHTDRPDPSYKRAILFPSDEVKPKLVWVECKPMEGHADPGCMYECPQVQGHLGGKLGNFDGSPEYKPIPRNVLLDQNLTNTLMIICRDTFMNDGSITNKSIVKATQGTLGYSWRGPILVMKEKGSGIHPRLFLDIDIQDIRKVVDHFISYRPSDLAEDEDVRGHDIAHTRKGKKISGVKIHCEGDQMTYGVAGYAAVDVPAGHPVFSNAIAPISKLVGMPLHTWQYPPDKAWRGNFKVYTNVPATFLHRKTDESSGDWWGRAPAKWQKDVGSVLVVRSDGRDVSVQQVEALCHFCQFKMQPLFENALGRGLVTMSRAEVIGYMTPQRFGDYFAEMKARKMDEGEGGGWETAGVPA